MKNFTKSLFAAVMFIAGLTDASAQVDNTFRFVDNAGNEISDGGVYYTRAELIDKMPALPGMVMVLEAPFDLSVENTTSDVAYVSAIVTTKSMSSGTLQFCFPSQCETYQPVIETSSAGIPAGKKQSLQSEWLPEDGKYDDAEFEVQLRVMDVTLNGNGLPVGYTFKANGPKITIKCTYADPAGVDELTATGLVMYNVYDMSGRLVVNKGTEADIKSLAKGLYVCETVVGGKRVSEKKIIR